MPPRHRPDLTEWMDDPDVDPIELARNLGDIRAFNTVFGWRRAAVAELKRLTGRIRRWPVRVLDVATGSADIPLAFLDALGRERKHYEVWASDAGEVMLQIARCRPHASRLRLVRHDARVLPFADASFDVVTLHLSLHHFPPSQAVMALRDMGRAGRHVLVTDLERSWLALLASKLAPLVTRNRLTRHDGPVSIRRAYTVREVERLAERAGLTHIRVRRRFPARFVMLARGQMSGTDSFSA